MVETRGVSGVRAFLYVGAPLLLPPHPAHAVSLARSLARWRCTDANAEVRGGSAIVMKEAQQSPAAAATAAAQL